MRNYVLDTKLLPEVWVTWKNKDGRIWMNNKGVRYNRPQPWMRYDSDSDVTPYTRASDDRYPFGSKWSTRNNNKLWVSAGSSLYYAYAKYHADIDRLEVAAVRYDTTRGAGEHTWMYDGDRFFIGKDKSVINQNGAECYRPYNVKKHGVAYDAKDMLRMIMRLTANDLLVNEFKKFIGSNHFVIGNGTSVVIEHYWHIEKWFMSVQKGRSKGNAQRTVDALIALPLRETDDLAYQYPPKASSHLYYREDINNIVYFERVNDEWSVLRALVRKNDMFDEAWRAYLSDDGKNIFASKTHDGWISSSQPNGYWTSRGYYFANEQDAFDKCDRIRYIAPMFSYTDDICVLLTTLRYPCIEQLYKLGHRSIAESVAKSATPKARMKEIFGFYNEKEKSVLRQIGMTKYQLDEYCTIRVSSRYNHTSRVIGLMREIFGNDLSRVDNATYSAYLQVLNELSGNFYAYGYVDMLDVDKSRFWKNMVRLHGKNSNSTRLIADTICTYRGLSTRPQINWLFDDYAEIVRVHDSLLELQRIEEAEMRAYWHQSEAERRKKDEEKRKKTDEERKHYEYEDDEFIIRLPKSVTEIVTEGSVQHICIGGYTSRHSSGNTNLFFLRRKDAEDIPFYAIEMGNDKCIVQIHGFGNRWLGNNPEAIPTVVRWLRKNGIRCDQKILTCTATGYGHTNNYIEMPKVD